MLFKELNKFIKSVIDFINGVDDITKPMSENERRKLIKYLKKAGIEIEE